MYKLIISIAFVLLAAYGCKSSNSIHQEDPEEGNNTSETSTNIQLSDAQLKNAHLQFGQIQERPISAVLQVFGKIDVPPQNMVSISIPMGGYLRSTKLLPGMHVNKGEVLARMEDQQYIQLQQDYLTTKAQMDALQRAYDRQVRLNTNQAGSDKALQEAEAAYKSARISLRALAEKLRLININPDRLDEDHISRSIPVLSPIDGFVSKVNVNVGKYVNAAEVLFELVNPDDIHLNLTVFEKDLAKLSVGQAVNAYTNSNPDQIHQAEIILISRDLDSSHTAEVHCHFEKYDKQLRPGTYMNAKIEMSNQQVATLPAEAVINKDGKDYVFFQSATNSFILNPVETGVKEDGFIEIKDALSLTDKKIVVKGAYALLMEMNKESGEE